MHKTENVPKRKTLRKFSRKKTWREEPRIYLDEEIGCQGPAVWQNMKKKTLSHLTYQGWKWTKRSGGVASWGERLTRISAEIMDVKRVVVVAAGLELTGGLNPPSSGLDPPSSGLDPSRLICFCNAFCAWIWIDSPSSKVKFVKNKSLTPLAKFRQF